MPCHQTTKMERDHQDEEAALVRTRRMPTRRNPSKTSTSGSKKANKETMRQPSVNMAKEIIDKDLKDLKITPKEVQELTQNR